MRTSLFPAPARAGRGEHTSASPTWRAHYTYEFDGTTEIADALTQIAAWINLRPNPYQPTVLQATMTGSTIRVFYTAGEDTDSTSGANGNLFGMYTYSGYSSGNLGRPCQDIREWNESDCLECHH